MLNIFRGSYGKYNRKELREVEITEQGTRSDVWQGIQHGEFVDKLIQVIRDLFGYHPINEQYAVSPNGAVMVGGFELGQKEKGERKAKPVLMSGIPQESTHGIAFMHGNDSSRALTMAAGGRVSMCSNGMVSGMTTFKRRHTSGLDLMEWLKTNIKVFIDMLFKTSTIWKKLTEFEWTPKLHDQGILAMARETLVGPWNVAGQVDEAWRKAQDGEVVWAPEGQDWGFQNTAWDWYQCITYIIKNIPVPKQLRAQEGALNLTRSLMPKKARPEVIEADFTVLDDEE